MAKIKTSNLQNIAWIIFFGIPCAFFCILLGASACISIVGIPVGIKQFKFIKFIFSMEDTALAYRPNTRKRLLGLYWYAFGGIGTKLISWGLTYLLIAFGGKHLAVRFVKVAPYLNCPFGIAPIENGKYTKNRNTIYDYNLLQRRIHKSPTIAIFDEKRGKLVTVRRYLKSFEEDVFSIKRNNQIVFFLFSALVIFGIASIIGSGVGIVIGVFLTSIGVIGCTITSIIQTRQFLKLYDSHMAKLFDLYDESDPYDEQPPIIQPYYIFDQLVKDREERKRLKNQRNNS